MLRDELVTDEITDVAGSVHKTIEPRGKPIARSSRRGRCRTSRTTRARATSRSERTVVERTLDYNTVKTFARTLRFMSLSKELVERNDFATKRDAYYQSKNWGDAKFNEQNESDAVHGRRRGAVQRRRTCPARSCGSYPEDHGGAVAGELIVIDHRPETGEEIEIDCTRFGSGAYSIPSSVEHLKFETKAKFVLAIETGGVFQRLNYHKYWRDAKCILVEMLAGVPTRATRRFIRRLADAHKLPGLRVYRLRSVRVRQHLPHAQGRLRQRGAHQQVLLRAAGAVPGRDAAGHPRPQADGRDTQAAAGRHQAREGRAEERPVLQERTRNGSARSSSSCKMGVRAEQQAFAKWDLNYVIDKYLPYKLKRLRTFLP